ncbi:zf-HC2 domain-containing protein [Streptomyces sp. A3M-1-3]|uniref:zf-HC2 domain-containing protein n=1 Tax=Streptomyces sp. A3M-1-3 TaxID=2962044 RepID=UPI0020B6F5A9|nr:zf-HC2 domain-containing protein [Streptomyces sp. A3M-1-3]MCP3818211.1 zf-HC2 domain-containing protein [Streptomyces sp. A3M-1-3]
MSPQQRHRDAGAYALGILDPAETFRFEEHLADCAVCVIRLNELAGVEALLAPLGEVGPPARPHPGLLGRLLDEVTARRRRSSRRRLRLVAAAAALILAAPAAALGWESRGDGGVRQFTATDAVTGVSAALALEEKEWGTDVGLRVTDVPGPSTCSLVAVGRNGEEQTVATWAVATASDEPLVAQGAAALGRDEIDHFEVRTPDGRRLVRVSIGL